MDNQAELDNKKEKKSFYLHPPFLVILNFGIMIPIGIVFARSIINIWDIISIISGIFLTIIFINTFIITHKQDQIRRRPNEVNRLITTGIYSHMRHPNFFGIILMNFAYLLFFRTIWLVPIIIIFLLLWYLEARAEEIVLVSKFGENYIKYKNNTCMFFPKLFK